MTVVLSAELEKLIEEKVREGLYSSPEAVLRAALQRLLEEENEFATGELDALIQVGLAELDRGEGLDGEQVFRELRQMSEEARRPRQAP